MKQIVQTCAIELSIEEWYQLYLATGHPLP